MISRLRGKLVDLSGLTATLDVQGVGYELQLSRQCVDGVQVGAEVEVVVLTVVREDSITLYGFKDRLERQVFLLLTQVKGVGAKSACAILAAVDRVELLRLIGAGDLQALASVRGIGRKTAERILVELKDRVADYAVEEVAGARGAPVPPNTVQDAMAAMESLGFSRRDAERAVAAARQSGLDPASEAGAIVREALRYI